MPENLETADFARIYAKVAKRWLSPDDLVEEYGFSKSTQAKMRMRATSSSFPFSKIGGKCIRYDKLAIDRWLEEHSVQGGLK